MNADKNERKAHLGRIALLGATLIWGTSFVVLKNTLDSVPTLYVLGIRFLGAAIVMALVCIKKLHRLDMGYLKGGAVMGSMLFLAYAFQTFGLEHTTPGKNAFLTTSYCILVPFLQWGIYRKKPNGYNVLAAVVCIVGVGLVSLQENLSIGIGDGLTLACGLFYGLHMIVTEKYIKGREAALLTLVQFAVAGALAWVLALTTTEFPEKVPVDAAVSIVYLCVMCTATCFFLQTFGQKYTPAAAVAVIMTLESVFGAILSAVFYHEPMSFRLVSGFALIFVAVLISETRLEFLKIGKRKT